MEEMKEVEEEKLQKSEIKLFQSVNKKEETRYSAVGMNVEKQDIVEGQEPIRAF